MRADLIERLRKRRADDEPDFTDYDAALMHEAADALAALSSPQEPVAFIQRDTLEVLRKDKHAITTVCSGLLKKPFGDPVPLYASPVEPVAAAKAEATGWPEIAEYFRQAMLDAEDILNRVPLEATATIDLNAVAMSRAADRLRQARHDMIYKYGPEFLNAAPTRKGEGL